MGPSVVVVTDNDPELARREAKRLADMLMAVEGPLVRVRDAAVLVDNGAYASSPGVVGGGGGGRPAMAQAGGRDASRLDEALDVARRAARDRLGGA